MGKTTILKQFSQNLNDFAFITCDEVALKEFSSARDFLNYFSLTQQIDFSKIKYLILDEVQLVKNISIFLKDLHDNYHFKIFASGSGSLKIFQGISESLIGRKEIINIHPFSFTEFLQHKKTKLLPINELTPALLPIYEELLDEYLLFGSYPEVLNTANINDKIKNLISLYQTYSQQDIIHYIKQKDLYAFEKFYKLMASSITSLQKLDALRQEVGIHISKAKEFSFILENTFILNLTTPFVQNKSKEVKAHKKIYFTDTGFANSAWNNFVLTPDKKWQLTENFVASELLKEKNHLQEIYFWRKKSQVEIDFIIRNIKTGEIIPIEVKSWSTDTIPKSFRSFYRDYGEKVKYFIVLNKDIYKERSFEKSTVLFLPHYYTKEILSI